MLTLMHSHTFQFFASFYEGRDLRMLEYKTPAVGWTVGVWKRKFFLYFLCLLKESNKEKAPRKPNCNENEPDDMGRLAHFQMQLRTFRGHLRADLLDVLSSIPRHRRGRADGCSLEKEVLLFFLCLPKERTKEREPRKPNCNEKRPDPPKAGGRLAHFQRQLRSFRGHLRADLLDVLGTIIFILFLLLILILFPLFALFLRTMKNVSFNRIPFGAWKFVRLEFHSALRTVSSLCNSSVFLTRI
ncbi:MAG: hypothetical protein ACRCYO_11360 [Bacteroidia bacterium]